ncbi:MAG: winged helix-turn-helix domain-containing protein [Gammaproteobacteria bacterium]|nr:winged helix-turn-helix domain-containing protein [Gammaproteobacteria bacterium]
MVNSWMDAIIQVLKESGRPMHYKDLTGQILSRGYYRTDGATPAESVNRTINSSINRDGEKSPFVRTSRGTYRLRNSPIARGAPLFTKPKEWLEPKSMMNQEDFEKNRDEFRRLVGFYRLDLPSTKGGVKRLRKFTGDLLHLLHWGSSDYIVNDGEGSINCVKMKKALGN